MTYEFRSPVYSTPDGQQIDMEINHPVFGWVPYTARPDAGEQINRDMYAAALLCDVGDYVAPEPVANEPYLNNGGLIRFSGNPVIVAENIRMSGATRVRKGVFRAYHEEAYPSNQYSATPSVLDANRCVIQATARTATYIEVRVWDAAGALYDPAEITVKTERVII